MRGVTKSTSNTSLKNFLYKEEHYEKFVLEEFKKLKN